MNIVTRKEEKEFQRKDTPLTPIRRIKCTKRQIKSFPLDPVLVETLNLQPAIQVKVRS